MPQKFDRGGIIAVSIRRSVVGNCGNSSVVFCIPIRCLISITSALHLLGPKNEFLESHATNVVILILLTARTVAYSVSILQTVSQSHQVGCMIFILTTSKFAYFRGQGRNRNLCLAHIISTKSDSLKPLTATCTSYWRTCWLGCRALKLFIVYLRCTAHVYSFHNCCLQTVSCTTLAGSSWRPAIPGQQAHAFLTPFSRRTCPMAAWFRLLLRRHLCTV